MDALDPRLLRSTLRWRMRSILRSAQQRQRVAARLVPALLHANFTHADLKGEALGIEGQVSPRGWAVFSRAFNLAPPASAQRGRRLIRAVLVAENGGALEVAVVPVWPLGELETERIEARLTGAEAILRRGGVDVRIRKLVPQRASAAEGLRWLLFGGLIVGDLSAEDFGPAPLGVPGSDAAGVLAAFAPSPLATLLHLFLVGGWSRSPLGLLQELHDEGHRARLLADPELFAALCARAEERGGELPSVAAALAGRSEEVRRLCRSMLPRGSVLPADRDALLAFGTKLALALARLVRRSMRSESREARALLQREVLAPGVPLALREVLRAAPLPPPDPWGDRSTMGAAPGGERAFARKLLLGGAQAELDPFWRRVAALGSEGSTQRTMLLSAEVLDEPGPPMDPLNRGPARKVALADPLVVTLRPDARPTARRLGAGDAVGRLVLEASRGSNVEVVALAGTAQPAVSRLVRLVQLAKAGGAAHAPLALEVGGRVLLLDGSGRVRHFALQRFAARPRRFVGDPESPDLSPEVPRGGAAPRRFGSSVDLLVAPLDASSAVLIYTDAEGIQLREVVPLSSLEEHIQEAQALLRTAPVPTLLGVRVAGTLDPAALRSAGAPLRAEVAVEGELLHGLRFDVAGERFGVGQRWGWAAAAASILSVWPHGKAGRIVVRLGRITLRGAPAGPLARLYARSVVTRRLGIHLDRTQGT